MRGNLWKSSRFCEGGWRSGLVRWWRAARPDSAIVFQIGERRINITGKVRSSRTPRNLPSRMFWKACHPWRLRPCCSLNRELISFRMRLPADWGGRPNRDYAPTRGHAVTSQPHSHTVTGPIQHPPGPYGTSWQLRFHFPIDVAVLSRSVTFRRESEQYKI